MLSRQAIEILFALQKYGKEDGYIFFGREIGSVMRNNIMQTAVRDRLGYREKATMPGFCHLFFNFGKFGAERSGQP